MWARESENGGESNLIEVKHLVKQYGEKVAVNDLSFTVQDGEVLGFLGPNGAGKSTTMNILTGYLSATSGEVRIDGVDMAEEPERAKKNIGYLPEIPPLYTDMTVEEYLRFVFRLKKVGRDVKRDAHIADICERVYLREVKGRLIRNLSKGYRQRVGIAQAMIGDPKILILDEPTVGLDPKQILEIRDLIRSLRARHTIVLSSHILQEIQAVCTRILIINEGRLAADECETGQRDRYRVLVEGPKSRVASVLGQLPGVQSVRIAGEAEPGVVRYLLAVEPGYPIRRAVFDRVVQSGWRLLGLEQGRESLEERFLMATSGQRFVQGREEEL